jgi:NAD(P)-dependent dehydrogenase (short-subunit alcohol dehydrogenase family)
MLLGIKNAVIYGGGGSIGGAVAREFAREGARVILTGRTRETLETAIHVQKAVEMTQDAGTSPLL